MRSLKSLHEKRACGPQNFRHLQQNDFCNTIRTAAEVGALWRLVIPAPSLKETAPAQGAMLRPSFHRTPVGRAHPVAHSQATPATFVPSKAAGVPELGQHDPPRVVRIRWQLSRFVKFS